MLSNGKIEIVIVPAIGRVMQMRFVGEEDGPFWELPELYGKAPDPEAKTWLNFGGDKTWPAPQSEWPRITPRSWPPPQAFDAMPVEAIVKEGNQGSEVELRSPVDPHYGIRTHRYKLIFFNKLNQWELYDLQKDPQEMKNVYQDPAYAKVVEQLKAELLRQRKSLNDNDQFADALPQDDVG